jgi:basic membrane protein A
VVLTSVMKNMHIAVRDAIKMAKEGKFQGGVYVGTLKNGGVGIAPFHEFDSKVPASLKAELEEVAKGIKDGSIATGWK